MKRLLILAVMATVLVEMAGAASYIYEETSVKGVEWIEKLCVQDFKICDVLIEMHTQAEHIQKTSEFKTRLLFPLIQFDI